MADGCLLARKRLIFWRAKMSYKFMKLGSRFGEKDILLLAQNIHFEFLADRFLLPAWFPYKIAFSLGDVLISMGAFWLLAKPNPKLNSLSKEGVAI